MRFSQTSEFEIKVDSQKAKMPRNLDEFNAFQRFAYTELAWKTLVLCGNGCIALANERIAGIEQRG